MRTASTSPARQSAGRAPVRPVRPMPRAVAVLAVLGVLLAACRDSADTSSAAPAPGGSSHPGVTASGSPDAGDTASAGDWTTVATLSGGGDLDTEPFTVHGRKVRFVYTVQPNSTGPVPLLWSMFAQGEPVDPASPRASQSCVSCDGEQTNDLGVVPAGSYYLHVITSRSWTLKVEEQS